MTVENFILQNPSQGSVHNLTIPTNSIVYIGYRQDSFPGVIMPFPTLIWNDIDFENKRQDWENMGYYYGVGNVQVPYIYGKVKPDETVNLVAFRLYSGCVPYQGAITIQANGYSRTGSGTVTRTVYERPNGETYMIDVCPDQNGANSLPCITGSANLGFSDRTLGLLDNKVWRDANGIIIGGSMCKAFYRIVAQKVGGRIRPVATYKDIPNSAFGDCPNDGTQVGEATTVEVTDGLFAQATPITFTLNLNIVEKSYSYIQF